MNKFVRMLTLAAAVGATLTTASCSSKNDDQVQPQSQTAILSGQVTPANTITTVTATNARGVATTTTVTSVGTYAFTALPLGDYNLTFTPIAGYAAPTPVVITLKSGGTIAATITVVLAAASASYSVDGTAMTASYVFSQALSGSRALTFTANAGSAPPTVNIFLDSVIPTVGTRSLTTNSNLAQYTSIDNVAYLSTQPSPSGGALSGTFTVSSVSSSPRVFSGTFSFVGANSNPPAPAPATRTITNGVFTNVPY